MRAVDGIPLCLATPGWFPHCKCDCKCCWWMSCRWNFIVFCNFRIVPATQMALSCLVDHVFQLNFGKKSRRIASFCRCSTCILEGSLIQSVCLRDRGSTKCVFQYKGRLRTLTVSGRSCVMFGSCSNRPSSVLVFSPVFCVRTVHGIPWRFATPGWCPHCKCDCKRCWWMSRRWNFFVFCKLRIVSSM